MSEIAGVRLSEPSIVLKKGEKTMVKAEVINSTGAVDKSRVNWTIGDKDIANYYGGSVARYQDYLDTVLTIQGVSPGSTFFKIYSVVDSTKFAILNINVIDDSEFEGSSIYIPHTILLNPNEITVLSGQYFCIQARGVGGMTKNDAFNYHKYSSNWEFVANERYAGGHEPKLQWKQNTEAGSLAWFKSDWPGTYQIHVYNPTFPEFGISFCTVNVLRESMDDGNIRLQSATTEIEFLDHDTGLTPAEALMYDKNPTKCSFEVYGIASTPVSVSNHASEIGWIVPNNSVIANISAGQDSVSVSRGYDYGIVPVRFYMKSNPYVYFPIWVETNGGNYKKYIPEANPDLSEVCDIQMTEIVTVIQKGALAHNVIAWARDGYGRSINHRVSIKQLAGTTQAGVTVLFAPGDDWRHYISISADKDVPDGVVYVRVYSDENPSVARLLTIYVVTDASSFLVPIRKTVTGIELDRHTLSMGIGTKTKIGYSIFPNGADIQDVTWSTSDPGVVRIDENGNLIGVGKGNAIVGVMTVDGGYVDTCNVSVGGHISVTKLTVSPQSVTAVKGTTVKLSASIAPSNASDKTVTWSSQDTSIATVDPNGIVSAKSAGYTNIIATAESGLIKVVVPVAVFDDESDIPSVNPQHPELNVRSISLSKTGVRVQVDSSFTLVSTITYEDGHRTIASDNSIWSSSDTSIATVDELGLVRALSVGSAVITVRAKDNPTVSARCTVTVVNSGSYNGGDDGESNKTVDYIYRIDYDGDSFKADMLFSGDLGFSLDHPIESVVYYETEDIQKIYWVDGIHPLRFMNFMAKPDSDERARWADGTYFDSNRRVGFDVNIEVSKDNSGNTRANGVAQYLLTYFNEHGQETNYAWISDLIYLSPEGHGGAADGYNSNRVTLTIKQNTLDTSYTHFRVYSVFRSALNGATTAYLVSESRTSNDEIIIVDDGAHLIAQDSSRLLYLGSQPVHANTLTHKDGVLFLGNLGSVGRNYDDLETAIRNSMFSMRDLMDGKVWKSSCVTFEYSDEVHPEIAHIPYVENSGIYNYENQLIYSSSQITTFKGGEKYRFALKFQLSDGTETDAFWIGDAENDKYPVIENGHIKRVVAKCQIPAAVFQAIEKLRNESNLDIKTVQLMIAEATYADRSVKAQGFINPTMFSTWERYNDRLYSVPSWITRPRNSGYACSHFEPVHNATGSDGEIECNFWKEDAVAPVPFYQYENYGTPEQKYATEYNISTDADYNKVVYYIWCSDVASLDTLVARAITVRGSWTDAGNVPPFQESDWDAVIAKYRAPGEDIVYERSSDGRTFIFNFTQKTEATRQNGIFNQAIEVVYNQLAKYVSTDLNMQVVDRGVFSQWCYAIKSEAGRAGVYHYYTDVNPNSIYPSFAECANSFNWNAISDGSVVSTGDNYPAYYTKQYMFVDENIVTLNSPELSYEAVSLDKSGLKFRIIGAAKITSGKSDYTVDASVGRLAGKNLMDYKFSWFGNKGNSDGLLSWPLWKDAGLMIKQDTTDPDYAGGKPSEKRNSSDYIWNPGNGVFYWLHMWGRLSSITGFTDEDNNEYGRLRDKVFANLHYSYETIYSSPYEMDIADVRHFNFLSSQYVQIHVGNTTKAYDGNPSFSLLAPSVSKYPILWNYGIADSTERISANADDAWLWTDEPVQISYQSDPHAVIAFPSKLDGNIFTQTILPYLFQSENIEGYYQNMASGSLTDAILPWMKNEANGYIKYRINQGDMRNRIRGINDGDKYLFIAELYRDFTKEPDTRYGGVTESAVSNCRFIAAGPQYVLSELVDDTIYGNQGDTYFQRWDCMKTKPGSTSTKNGVIDITSVMLETHINIDGRTDLNRGINELASIKPEEFGKLNPVYSHSNNFIARHDLDDDFNLDYYPSSITWTLEKHDSEDVDEWTHVTLANTLKLDGDKGVCQALRRMGNSIIAFQDRGISEILFNSRTQLSTQDGVPVEIANSGKVDGKRYITNKYGCVNKWSIIEGKNALYFVDNINKAFCSFNGQAIDNLSTRLGFGAWFREINNIEPWAPSKFNNIVSYYDKVHSDIYLVRNKDDKPCLVYNETLGAFTSFFDYQEVPMITNVEDRLVSFRDNKLWLQNEGLYCNFFGKQYDYWTQYRVTPDPFSDKIWTNIDYRADFFEVLDDNAQPVVSESELINGDIDDTYKEWETFTDFKVWDEYQDTGFTLFAHEQFDRDDVRKKFRIWRLVIPRALKEGTNKHGMDRIRNPWINLLFRKNNVDGKYLMQLHDIVVKYFE